MPKSKKATSGRPRTNPKPAGQVQSLSRGLTLLQQLALADGGLSLTDIAARVELPNSTTHRLLTTMEELGFVYNDEARRHWLIGVEAFTVGTAYLNNRDFTNIARPFMQQLVADSGETSNLGILNGDEVVFVAQVECSEIMRMVAKLGSRSPVHASGVGKALLANMSDVELARLFPGDSMARLTDKTLTSLSALKRDLQQTRERGYALDDEEQKQGLRCVAAGIYNEFSEAIAAISVSGPIQRVDDQRIAVLGELVTRAAMTITSNIGGRAP